MKYQEIISETIDESQEINLVSRHVSQYVQRLLNTRLNPKTLKIGGIKAWKYSLRLLQMHPIFATGVPFSFLKIPYLKNKHLENTLSKCTFKLVYGYKVDDVSGEITVQSSKVNGEYALGSNTIYLYLPRFINQGVFDSTNFEQTLAHEITHALDHQKSNGRFQSKSYTQQLGDKYLRQPEEINARVQEAMSSIYEEIKTLQTPDNSVIIAAVKKAMAQNHLDWIYPKDSRGYKQIVKRLWMYAHAEITNPKKVHNGPMLKRIAAWVWNGLVNM